MDEMDRDSGNKTQSIDDVSITLCQNSSWTMDSKIYVEVLKKMLELFLKIQGNIRIPIPKRRLRNLCKKENFKSEVKPMIENLQDELYELENKQAKSAKLCANVRWDLGAKNAPTLSSKYLQDRICKIKQHLNYIH